MREQFGMSQQEQPVRQVEVTPEFRSQLATLWQAYLPIAEHLAADNFPQSRQSAAVFATALNSVDAKSVSEFARGIWNKESANLTKVVSEMQSARNITSFRASFSLLSEEMKVLVKRFGFGDVGSVYQLHCPMAFNNRGAIWFQNHDEPRNPYYGATMLKCADRIELIAPQHEDPSPDQPNHAHHK